MWAFAIRLPLALPVLALAGAAWGEAVEELDPSVVQTGAEALVYEALPDALPRRGLPEMRHDFAEGGFVRFYGHINWGILNYDDGRETQTYAPLDNANSISRIGLLAERPVGGDWLAVGRVEVGYAPYSSFSVNQLDDDPDWEFNEDNIRWIDLSLRSDSYGWVSVGQGSMATDGITLIDFSGTNLIAYSSVADSAAGQFLRFADPTRPIGEAPTVGAAYQGLDGPRRLRARYDTPSFFGLRASVAYGRNILTTDSSQHEEDLYDVALTYAQTFGDFSVGTGVGYFWDRFDREIVSGSAAAIHVPTGLNLAFASGELDTGTRTADYWWLKAGLRRDLLGIGDTAVSVDYYDGDDMVRSGSESRSWGVALVQNLPDANTELWLTWRTYDYDETGTAFEDARAVFGGLRFRF